jgi:fucose permease
MKADRTSRETGTRLPCRDHPGLCLSLFVFMFVPAVAGEIALGRWLTRFMPHPGLTVVVCFAPAMVVLFIIGMLIGATVWLLLMKRFVQQESLAAFFLGGPRVPVFSNLCAKIFAWSHGTARPKTE